MLEQPVPESDSRDQNDETRKPEEAEPVVEDRNTSEETENGPEEQTQPPQHSTATSVFSNFTVFRDFFLAAFSDGYNVCEN